MQSTKLNLWVSVACVCTTLLFSAKSHAKIIFNQFIKPDTGSAVGSDPPIPEDRTFYNRNIAKTKKAIDYENFREADAFWQKRVWRLIDTREKMNFNFKCQRHYPNELFFNIINKAALSGEIKAFKTDDCVDSFTINEIVQMGTSKDSVPIIDPITGNIIDYKEVINQLDYNKVNQFRIMEDWYFDEQTSTMKVRIIVIAPIFEKEVAGQIISLPMYWIYYPDIRKSLAKIETFNPKNDAIKLTWDDIFEMRYFSSYITKESNVYDRTISTYSNGIDALLEAEKIKNEMINKEQDIWSY
jgi:gliding motility associated protien GldN